MSEYIQILFFLSITTLVIIIFLFFKKNSNIEKENVKLSSLVEKKDLQIENLTKQIEDNENFSDNLKNAVNAITGDIFEKRTKDFKEESSENLKNILTPLNDEIKRFNSGEECINFLSKVDVARKSYIENNTELLLNEFNRLSNYNDNKYEFIQPMRLNIIKNKKIGE